MYYLPGTHKMTSYDKKGHFGPNMGALFDEYPEFREIEPVAAEMKAGSAGFHNGLIAHAAGPNMTPASAPGDDMHLYAGWVNLQRYPKRTVR